MVSHAMRFFSIISIFLISFKTPSVAMNMELIEKDNTEGKAPSVKQSIEGFPDEILIKIFSYLAIKENARVIRVSKKWKGLSEDDYLWKEYAKQLSITWEKGYTYKALVRRHHNPALNSFTRALRGNPQTKIKEAIDELKRWKSFNQDKQLEERDMLKTAKDWILEAEKGIEPQDFEVAMHKLNKALKLLKGLEQPRLQVAEKGIKTPQYREVAVPAHKEALEPLRELEQRSRKRIKIRSEECYENIIKSVIGIGVAILLIYDIWLLSSYFF